MKVLTLAKRLLPGFETLFHESSFPQAAGESGNINPDARENFCFNLLQTVCKLHLPFLNPDSLNRLHAKTLAAENLLMNQWLPEYEKSLQNHIKTNIALIHGKKPFPAPPVLTKKRAINSLSNLYAYLCSVRSNQKEVKWCVDHAYKMANAHAFLQATGFATQNETSWLATVDFLNYWRIAGKLDEVKSILFKLIQPFAPLWREYTNINREENIFWQISRTVMPMIILSAMIVLVCTLLSAVVIPEIAWFFLLLPTLYLGLVASSAYIVLKDTMYNNLHQLWFGGQFEIPEYQVNDAMTVNFGNSTHKIRDYYVNEIKACFTKNKDFQKQVKTSQAEQKNHQENTERERVLLMEWYDVHSNPRLSIEESRKIVLNRLQLDGKKTEDLLQKTLQQDLEKDIPDFVHDVASEIKTSIEQNSPATTMPRMQDTEPSRFFRQPGSFKLRMKMEHLYHLKEETQNPGSQVLQISTHTGA